MFGRKKTPLRGTHQDSVRVFSHQQHACLVQQQHACLLLQQHHDCLLQLQAGMLLMHQAGMFLARFRPKGAQGALSGPDHAPKGPKGPFSSQNQPQRGPRGISRARIRPRGPRGPLFKPRLGPRAPQGGSGGSNRRFEPAVSFRHYARGQRTQKQRTLGCKGGLLGCQDCEHVNMVNL